MQNFIKLPPWVKKLCSMLQIAKDAAIMLQMQHCSSMTFYSVCNLIHYSYEVNLVLLPKIYAIPSINKEIS